jgi:hypothetical protein
LENKSLQEAKELSICFGISKTNQVPVNDSLQDKAIFEIVADLFLKQISLSLIGINVQGMRI